MSARITSADRGLPQHWSDVPDGAAHATRRLVPLRPDEHEPDEHEQYWTRSIHVQASAPTTYAWTCQLRRAPYSYDLIDNFGRQSPKDLDLSLLDPRPGDSVMTIFTVIDASPGSAYTVRMNRGTATTLFGAITLRYTVLSAETGSILVAEMLVPRAPGPLAGLRRDVLGWGDLLMMRKQLRVLRGLAEQTSELTADS